MNHNFSLVPKGGMRSGRFRKSIAQRLTKIECLFKDFLLFHYLIKISDAIRPVTLSRRYE